MAGGGGGSDSGEPEFQIAPMIDVLLVILIFFMTITSAQVLKVDKNDRTADREERAEEGQLARRDGGECPLGKQKRAEFVYDDRVYRSATEIVEQLKTAKITGEKNITAGANPTFRAVIRGDRDVPALYVSQAMNACAEAGISDISFSATNKE